MSVEDLFKMVDDMFFICLFFVYGDMMNQGFIVYSVIGYDGIVGQSYVVDFCVFQFGSEVDNNFY